MTAGQIIAPFDVYCQRVSRRLQTFTGGSGRLTRGESGSSQLYLYSIPQGGLPLVEVQNTVNVDIFACRNFPVFTKMDNFTWIKIPILRMIGSLGFYKSDVHGVHIFFDI